MNPPPLYSPENPFGDPDQARRERNASIRKGLLFGCGGCATLAFMVVALIGGIIYFIFSGARSSEPFQRTLQAAQASPEMRSKLGEPITLGYLFSGSVNWTNGTGTADVQIPLSGPKGSTTVHTIGTKTPTAPWIFTKMQTTTAPEINLLSAP
jgi:hypothetical protein